MDEDVPKPSAATQSWSLHSVFGPSLVLVDAPNSIGANAITWRLQDDQGRSIGRDCSTGSDPDEGFRVRAEQFKPHPDSKTVGGVVGDPGEEHVFEFVAEPPRYRRR